MKFEFSHPVMAHARLPASGQRRICVGMVETPVEIVELAGLDVEKAFELHKESRTIIRHADRLYHPAPDDIDTLLSADIGNFALLVDHDDLHMSRFTDALRIEIRRAAQESEESLYPLPRGRVLKQLLWDDSEGVMRWLSSVGPLSSRRITDVEEADVLRWRERVSAFFANFVMVDGELYARCHEPIIQATPFGLFLDDYSFYRSHVDYPERDYLGFPSGKGKWAKDIHVFPADMYAEARAFVLDRGWMVGNAFLEGDITVHGECLSYATLLENELVRTTCHYIGVSDFAIQQLEKSSTCPVDPDFVRAVADLKGVATRYGAGQASIQELDDALADFTALNAGSTLAHDYQDALRDLNRGARAVLSRRENLPISGLSVGVVRVPSR